MGQMIELTGLWKMKSEAGGTYLAGSLRPGLRVIVISNKGKEKNPKAPDFHLMIAPSKRDESKSKPKRQNPPDEFAE